LTKPKKILLQKVVLLLKKLGSVTKKLSIYFVDKKEVEWRRKKVVGRITTHHPLQHHSTYYRPTFISINKTTVCSTTTVYDLLHFVEKKLRLLV
jgi:hypothetical protein